MKSLFVMIALSLAPISFASTQCIGGEEPSIFADHLNIGPFTYKMTYNPQTNRGQFNLLRRGKIVYSQRGSHFYINPASKCGDLPVAGISITGRRHRELAVVDWSGGAHCCYTLSVIALEDPPFLIQKIELEHSWPDFQDVDKDGVLELLLSDWTFAYWRIPFAQSPAPQVTLGFNGKKWAYEPKWNVKTRPLRGDFLKLQTRIEQGFKDAESDAGLGDYDDTGAPVVLWDEMLKLIYSGNADLAFELINATWPPKNLFKEKFLSDFRQQLQQSPFFEEIEGINSRNALLPQKSIDCPTTRGRSLR